jgi:hypothetical protein
MSEPREPEDRVPAPPLAPAQPLWRLAPTRGDDGRAVADFMMLIPGLADRPALSRDRVSQRIRAVCATYGERVSFADVNYRINVLWVSVDAVPGLAGQVASAIRSAVPEALLIGGQLGAASACPALRPRGPALRQRLRLASRRALRLLVRD